ncbi:MAG: YdeI family protein [Kofleriaceae bacterium]
MKPTFFATPAAWRAWLEANHATKSELLVGFYKTSSGKPSITWPESVDEALCFGWIDGVRKSLGDEAYTIRFTPRKPTSIWSAINVAKVEQLRKAGKMRPAGEAAYAKLSSSRTSVYSFERLTAAQFTPAQQKQWAASAKALAWFRAEAPSYQKAVTHWVVSAKQEATQAKRLAHLIHHSANGERIPMMTKYTKPAKTNAKPRARKKRT